MLVGFNSLPSAAAAAAWTDASLPAQVRTRDLVPRMTLQQKAATMVQQVSDLVIGDGSGTLRHVYNAECLHGPHNTGYTSTVYPSPIGMAASFDVDLVRKVGVAIADDLRSKWNEGQDWSYCFAPDVNIVRDPRYGRGQETWGEDPLLAGLHGRAFVQGLQNGSANVEGRPEVGATCKHWLAYDHAQGYQNAVVDPKNLFESYIPAFEGCAGATQLGGAGAMSVMCSYGMVNGVPTCADPDMLTMLREELGFGEGVVVSDCGAVKNLYTNNWTKDGPSAAAAAVQAGVDMNCGPVYGDNLTAAVRLGLVSNATVDRAVSRVLAMRFALGQYDAPEDALPAAYSPSALNASAVVDSKAHRALALEIAQAGLVLLKNLPAGGGGSKPLLPLPWLDGAGAEHAQEHAQKQYTIAVVGPLADDVKALMGESNYAGKPPFVSTVLGGLRNRSASSGDEFRVLHPSLPGAAPAVAAAREADVVVCVLGHDTAGMEDEGADRSDAEYALKAEQQQLLESLASKTSTPIVLVLVNGMAIGTPWASDGSNTRVATIVEALRGGQVGGVNEEVHESVDEIISCHPRMVSASQSAGDAVAGLIFGDFSPSGRMPYSVVRQVEDLPPYNDMDMTKGRGYRYPNASAAPPLYLFGDGLSFTDFKYSGLSLSPASGPASVSAPASTPAAPVQLQPCESLELAVTVTNSGARTSSEVVQVYVSVPDVRQTGIARPRFSLAAVRKTEPLAAGASTTIRLTLSARAYSVTYNDGSRFLEAGDANVKVYVGGSSPAGLAASGVQVAEVSVLGAAPVPLATCPLSARIFG